MSASQRRKESEAMGKKQKWASSQVTQAYPGGIYPADVIDKFNPNHCARAAFIVYEIQNGYLLRTEVLDESPSKMVYCKDIQELSEQILTSQAQMRLNLK
jgi:hypothetical protein